MLNWLFRLLTGQKRAVSMTAEEVVQYALQNFDRVTEAELARTENEVKRVSRESPESSLLYAMRVSKCVPRVTTLKALASRWQVANYGPRMIGGLSAATRSRNYRPVYEFLTSLYLTRFAELAREVAVAADKVAIHRKTVSARLNAMTSGMQKIRAGRDGLLDLPGIREEANRWLGCLKERSSALRGPPGTDTKRQGE